MTRIAHRKPYGWKIIHNEETLNEWFEIKIHALEKAEELADDVDNIIVENMIGEVQNDKSWKSLKSSYS